MNQVIRAYLNQLRQALDTGSTTEHTHRPALAALLEGAGPGIKSINEPQRIACGAPDLAVLRNRLIVGHIEAKDIGVSLDAAERSEQLRRYCAALGNLILTDYLEFRWYIDGDLRRSVRLARWDGNRLRAESGGADALEGLLTDFLGHTPQPIGTPRELAERMARLTHLIRDIVVTAFETSQASDFLQNWRRAFARILVAELDQPENTGEFADMFAQTLAYGLFSARVMDEGNEPFDRQRAQYLIPRTNPFLRDFFYHITGPQLDQEPYAGFVNDLVQLLEQADMAAILADFGKRTRQEDPTVHFYETFLTAYDPSLREMRGVYYTPTPVVSFIVRSVDALLKSRFGLPSGLADTSKVSVKNTDTSLRVKGKPKQVRKTRDVHTVLILDPATGTGTFPYAVIDFIREQFMEQGNAGMWSGYVREHLLPRIYGFELLMAPYAVAHFRLASQLSGHDLPEGLREQWAYDFASDERIRVYLTNALEGPHELSGLPLFTQFLANETQAANAVKQDLPIMVVLGNPPYSGHSSNTGEWISDLLRGKLPDGGKTESYYEVDGKPLGERNPKWLQDDYVKFIRFGQWRIEQSGGGVLAFISNNGYLDNPTFRGMRQSLIQTFSEIYILNLHGNARKRETTPDGAPDENVFDIMQGVAIGLFVKEPRQSGFAKIHYADLWGSLETKHQALWDLDVDTVDWKELDPQSPFYLLVPLDTRFLAEYERDWQITDIMPTHSVGLATARDRLTIQLSSDEIWAIVQDFAGLPVEQARQKYSLGRDVRDWKVHLAQDDIRDTGPDRRRVVPVHYRPFDTRFTYYTGRSRGFICMPRPEVMGHVLAGDNLVLITSRLTKGETFKHVEVTRNVSEVICLSSKTSNNGFAFPLYLYPREERTTLFDIVTASGWPPDLEQGNRVPNLAPAFISKMQDTLGLSFAPHKTDTAPGGGFGPKDVFAYIYAVLHCPTYRERYVEFLRIDFPRVPLTSNTDLFWRLIELGQELTSLHLLESPRLSQPITHYPIPGNSEVSSKGGFPKFAINPPETGSAGRVYINTKQYFEGIPQDVWEFQIGGYQVLHKWLKDRRGRLLTFDDLTHYQKIVVALQETINVMQEIDEAIPEWPIS